MTFYQNLRDGTAANLIRQFGRSATLRQSADSYDPTAGRVVSVPSDTPIQIVTLPRANAQKMPEFAEELVALFDQVILISGSELATAGVEPRPSDEVIIGGETLRVVGVAPIAPGGVAVIYKAGVAGGEAPDASG